MQAQIINGASLGAGAQGSKAPKVELEIDGVKYVATGYRPDWGRYRPTALEGKEDMIKKLWEIVNYLVGVDDTVTSITIRGIDAYDGKPYQVTIKLM